MPPILALFITFGFIFWLMRMDARLRHLSNGALWVPAIWLGMVSSRLPSFWLNQATGIQSGGTTSAEGNSVDMVVFLFLIGASFFILMQRNFDWGGFVLGNKLLIVLYLFLAASALWAENSFPTFKRAVKDFGAVLAVLVILTEKDPIQQIRTIFVRVSYFVIPLSIVFIKWFPEIGRSPSRGGDNMFRGVTQHKSNLGALIFCFGLFLVIDLLELRKTPGPDQKNAIRIRYLLLAMSVWLMYTCGSATSAICFSVGLFMLWGTYKLQKMAEPSKILFVAVTFVLLVGLAESSLGLSHYAFGILGKSDTLTGRTEIWEMASTANVPALWGVGYFSFWSGREAAEIQEEFIYMNSAHNGFLDMYLDAGLVGVSLLAALVLVTGVRTARRALKGGLWGRMCFVFWVVILVVNFAETFYFRLSHTWFIFLLLTIECPEVIRNTVFARAPIRRGDFA